MRFSVILIALALLPMMMIGHGWLFTETQLPLLREQALAVLQKNEIRAAVVDLRYLDLRIAGNAPDLESLRKVQAAISALGPVRLVADDLVVPASLNARLAAEELELEGWLPEEGNIHEVVQLLGKLRPDLILQTGALKAHERVVWPEGERGPLTADSRLLFPIVEKLRVAPWLEISRDTKGLHLRGILPANGVRSKLLKILGVREEDQLQESTHTIPASFADDAEALSRFVGNFLSSRSARRFLISEKEGPLIEAAATRSLESEWLALLRPVAGGRRVHSQLTLYPSEFHFPEYRPDTLLSGEQLRSLRQAVSGSLIQFSEDGLSLNSEEQSRLAALTPLLLAAGPALRLIIGGHPDPDAEVSREKIRAKARAEAVHSFLVEQGLPTSDVKVVSFDSVPAGTPGAPAETRTVEILIR